MIFSIQTTLALTPGKILFKHPGLAYLLQVNPAAVYITLIRNALLQRQRAFAGPAGLVADGRDMGSVVFPGAAVKIYLTASAEERAARRHKQLKEKGVTANLAALSLEIAERDRRDINRAVAPLVASPDAELIDTTGMPVEAVVERILAIVRERLSI